MSETFIVNNVPMQGQGLYSCHSALQTAAMRKAIPLLQNSARTLVLDRKHIAIIEYGSAHGNNS